MIDRKGVVGDADQQMMVLCLRVAPDSASKQLVDIRVTRNGHSLSEVDLYQVKQPRVVRKYQILLSYGLFLTMRLITQLRNEQNQNVRQ